MLLGALVPLALSLFFDGLQAFPRESKDKVMAAMLVVLTIDANEESFVKIPPRWPQ